MKAGKSAGKLLRILFFSTDFGYTTKRKAP
jgi:hypothetical protein